MKTDLATLVIWAGFWPTWLLWELVLLYMREKSIDVGTISMIARERAHQLNLIPFLWCGLAAHFWLNWGEVWGSPIPAIAFWVLVAATLGLDVWFWSTPYGELSRFWQIYRWPGTQVILGLILGFVLFPQKDLTTHTNIVL
jgi:hypothetical protein